MHLLASHDSLSNDVQSLKSGKFEEIFPDFVIQILLFQGTPSEPRFDERSGQNFPKRLALSIGAYAPINSPDSVGPSGELSQTRKLVTKMSRRL